MTAELKFIGHIETPYTIIEEFPSNIKAEGVECKIVLDAEYQNGLVGLDTDQAILVLYWFENSDRSSVLQHACWQKDGETTGVFSIRSPDRPNPIATAVLPIQGIKDGEITVQVLDSLIGTKVLDIKPAIRHESTSI